MTTECIITPIRVLVADEHQLWREGICALLQANSEITVISNAATHQEVIQMACSLSLDVLLMGVCVSIQKSLSILQQVKQQRPCCRVLILATIEQEAYAGDFLQAGADGFLLKNISVTTLLQTIQLVHQGIHLFQSSATSRLITQLSQLKPYLSKNCPAPMDFSIPFLAPIDDLTAREVDVLRLIANGASNREIATQLVISERTVKNHVSNILSRLGLRDRTQAAIYAREQLTLQ